MKGKVWQANPYWNSTQNIQFWIEVRGRGLPEAIKLKVDDWSHIQQLDYEQIPFKCNVCHEYGHFANRCTKIVNADNDEQDGHWESVKKKKTSPPLKSVMEPAVPGPSNLRPPSPSPLIPDPPLPPSSNPFAILSEAESDPDLPSADPPPHLSPPLPLQPPSEPPSSRITRSSSKDHGAPSDAPKKQGPGRKSAKQQRDESAQKDIALGTQTPIETFILGHLEKETSSKGHERRAPLHISSIS